MHYPAQESGPSIKTIRPRLRDADRHSLISTARVVGLDWLPRFCSGDGGSSSGVFRRRFAAEYSYASRAQVARRSGFARRSGDRKVRANLQWAPGVLRIVTTTTILRDVEGGRVNEAYYRDVLSQLHDDIRKAEAEEEGLKSRLLNVQQQLLGMRKSANSFECMLGLKIMLTPPARPTELEEDRPVRHADVAERVLREAGRPLRIPEFAALMAKTGHTLPEDERLRDSAIHSALRRRPHVFKRIGRGVYALAEWNLPEPPNQDDLHFEDVNGMPREGVMA